MWLNSKYLLVSDKFKSHYEYNTKVDIQMTRKIEEALEQLTNAFSVVLYGRPGEGKTAAAFRMVKRLINDNKVKLERCAILSESEDLKDIRSSELDLILIDDIFGRHNAEDDKISGWRNHLQTLRAFVGNHDVRVIIATRKHIYLEYKHVLEEIDAFDRAVELSSKELSSDENKQILISQLKYYSRNVDDVNIEKCTTQKESDAGFPLCAQQFSSDQTQKEEYFGSSYKICLLRNLRNLDSKSFIALLYVFYKENCLRHSDVDITTIDEESKKMLIYIASLCGVEIGVEMSFPSLLKTVKRKLNALNGSYLKCVSKTFSFLHSTMYETVALIHGEEYPSEVIKHCTLDFLCQCIRVQQGGIEGEMVIENDNFEFLIQRCINVVVTHENGKRLSKHPVFASKVFVDKFFEVVSKDETIMKNFLSTGLSFAYFGIHAFLYHIIENNIGRTTFVEQCLIHLKCEHAKESRDTRSCWKCPVKSEALTGACYADQFEIYENLRNAGANVTPLCLYKATENQSVGPTIVKRVVDDLKQARLFAPNDQTLEFCLGHCVKHEDKTVFKLLKDEGLVLSSQFLYFVVQDGDDELLSSAIKELIRDKRWLTEDIMISRSLLEAHIKQKDGMVTILQSAGVVLTEAAVYWAIIDHGYEEVVYVINSLKRKDALDVEASELAWGIAKAMKNEDKRIFAYLKAEKCVMSTSTLVLAMAADGQCSDEIYKVIKDLKSRDRWDPTHIHIGGAYINARRRSDKTLKDTLEKEGVTLSSDCFLYAYLLFADEADEIFETLQRIQCFDPKDRYFTRALLWAIQNKDELLEEKLRKQGIYLNMTCLITAVEPTFCLSTFETVVLGIKSNDEWDPNCDEALQALNVAVKRQDKSNHQKLLDEGLRWKTRNLYVAVQHTSVWELKQVIKYMKSMKLLETPDKEIQNAVQLARSFKDARKLDLLTAEKIVV